MSRSAWRRPTNSAMANSCSVLPAGTTNTCSIQGKQSSAIGPRQLSSVGTFRQPMISRPCSARRFSTAARPAAALFSSGLRNTWPTANSSSGSLPNSALAALRKKASGLWIRRPQPSPVFPSAAIPPRWVMQVSDSMAVCNNLWLASPFIWAIRPKPQLSLNSSG